MAQAIGIKSFIADFLKLPADKISDASTLADLVADSFQAVELLVSLQDEFGFMLTQDDMSSIDTLGGLLDLIENRIQP